jgi:hypothetical protein
MSWDGECIDVAHLWLEQVKPTRFAMADEIGPKTKLDITHFELFCDYQLARCDKNEMQTSGTIDCDDIRPGMDRVGLSRRQ